MAFSSRTIAVEPSATLSQKLLQGDSRKEHILMRSNSFLNLRNFGTLLLISMLTASISAQSAAIDGQAEESAGSGIMGYVILVIVAASLCVSYYFWRKSQTGHNKPKLNDKNRYKDYYGNNGSYDINSSEADAWLKKGKASPVKIPRVSVGSRSKTELDNLTAPKIPAISTSDANVDTKLFQEKMRKLQYVSLPINTFIELLPSKPYTPLPTSDDVSIVAAIEQAGDEFEEDEAVRDLAVRVLTAFRSRNSVEALAQIALYDLSANLRSKAVSILTDFDHESVFEAILLACADPTREVRAAAARGLFRLSFDRADSWKRIIETNDEFRMSHAARAALESGFVVKYFDRLVHEDLKVAYEAFALVAVLIRSGETEEIFNAIKDHRDERVRFALLHVLKVIPDERTIEELAKLQRSGAFSAEVTERIVDTLNHCGAVAV